MPTILSKEERCGFQLWLEGGPPFDPGLGEITKRAKPDLSALIATLTDEEKEDITARILTGVPVK